VKATEQMGYCLSALVRVPNKIKRPDTRIAFAMPPSIGTIIMMVMCGRIFFIFTSLLI
jgi:hypothetical protein